MRTFPILMLLAGFVLIGCKSEVVEEEGTHGEVDAAAQVGVGGSQITVVEGAVEVDEEVEAAVKEAIDQGAPLHNYSIDTVGLTEGVPDENVRIARKTAMAYGKLD